MRIQAKKAAVKPNPVAARRWRLKAHLVAARTMLPAVCKELGIRDYHAAYMAIIRDVRGGKGGEEKRAIFRYLRKRAREIGKGVAA